MSSVLDAIDGWLEFGERLPLTMHDMFFLEFMELCVSVEKIT